MCKKRVKDNNMYDHLICVVTPFIWDATINASYKHQTSVRLKVKSGIFVQRKTRSSEFQSYFIHLIFK